VKTVSFFLRFSACIGCFLGHGHGQVAYREDGRIAAAQRSLPSTGPGSAWFNPAALSETRLAHGQAGAFTSVSGKSGRDFWDLSAALPASLAPWLPVGISAGFGRDANESRIDGSNAIYVEYISRPSLAVAYPAAAEAPLRLAAGLAFPTYGFEAFGAAKSTSTALDLGLLGILEEKGTGRFRIGFTYHNLVQPEVKLPDFRGSYAIRGWWVTSFGYAAPGEWMRFLWELYYEEAEPASEGPNHESSFGKNAFELEVRPQPWMGIKAEVTRVASHSSLGAAFYPQFGRWPIRTYLEANIGHDRLDVPGMGWLLGPPQDEGRGYLFGFSFGVGI